MTVLDALPCVFGRVRVRALGYGDAAAFARGSSDAAVNAGYRQVGDLRSVTAPSGTVFTALTFERSVAEFRSNV